MALTNPILLRAPLGRAYSFEEADTNLQNLLRLEPNYVFDATVYPKNTVVIYDSNVYVSLVDTANEPGVSADWTLLAPAVSIQQILQWVADNFQVAVYAAMDDPDTGITSIGAGWTDITTYAVDSITPRGIVTDLAAGTMTFTYPGVYRLYFFLNMQGHNSSNQGRTTNLRIFNVTDGVPGESISVGIGRNVEDTLVNVSAPFELTEADTNKPFIMQIGGGDSVTSIDKMIAAFEAEMIGEWKEPLPW